MSIIKFLKKEASLLIFNIYFNNMQHSNSDNNLLSYSLQQQIQKCIVLMELEQSQIINIAVNIFQNVGIKRYIGQIDALKHQDIYFEIYKIIFPNSMINIFKISQSNMTTGEKIQKIIQQISSIIKFDLYHISGQAIAQGNRNHLTNWLQLLQALSNNCIVQQNYNGGGSAPDRDRQIQKEFQEDDYHTVQGVRGQFQKHVYTDQKPDSDQSQRQDTEQSEPSGHKNYKQKIHPHAPSSKKQKHKQKKDSMQNEQSQLNRSFRKSDSSRNSNVLKPIEGKKKSNNKAKTGKKKVTFKIEEGQQSNKNISHQKFFKTTMKKQNQMDKNTAASFQQPANHLKLSRRQIAIYQQYGYPMNMEPSQQEKLLRKKKSFISKMYKIEQQMQQKKINDQIAKFQQWAYNANAQSVRDRMLIQQQNNQRTSYINEKIVERQQFINSLSGAEQALFNIKQMFKKQKQNEKRMRKVMMRQQRKQALELMDLNFAADVENMVMATIGE